MKPQTEIFKSSKSGDSEQDRGKKRKRKHADEAKQDPNVRPDDVGRLWEQHIEGKDLSKSQKTRERKKQKVDDAEQDKSTKAKDEKTKSKRERKDEHSRDAKSDIPRKEGVDKKKSKKDAKREDRGEKQSTSDGIEKKAKKDKSKRSKDDSTVENANMVPIAQPAKLTPMQAAMRQKLVSARFRHLNQTLYTAPSKAAQDLFSQDPAMFEDYHAGFRQQVSVWPENPVDRFIAEIRRRAKIKQPKARHYQKRKANVQNGQTSHDSPTVSANLPRTNGYSVIADLGCGDARLARTLKESGDTTSLNLKLLSYDLHSPSPLVTKADISSLPLADGSVDVAIFCLALMGTNWISFIEEAHRILHWKGELWVAEIKSRFGRVTKAGAPVEHSVGGNRRQAAISKAKEKKQLEQNEENEEAALQTEVDGVVMKQPETDVEAFVEVLKRRGFMLKPPAETSVDLKNKMFVKMEFVKALTPTKGKGMPTEAPAPTAGRPKLKVIPDLDEQPTTDDETTVLKPCLYKLR